MCKNTWNQTMYNVHWVDVNISTSLSWTFKIFLFRKISKLFEVWSGKWLPFEPSYKYTHIKTLPMPCHAKYVMVWCTQTMCRVCPCPWCTIKFTRFLSLLTHSSTQQFVHVSLLFRPLYSPILMIFNYVTKLSNKELQSSIAIYEQ